MVDPDLDGYVDSSEHLSDEAQHLSSRHHRVEAGTGIVEVALVELAHISLSWSWQVSAVDLTNPKALDLLDFLVHRKPSSKWECKVVSRGAELSILILEVVDQLHVCTVLVCQGIFELEDWSVDLFATVKLRDPTNSVENVFAKDTDSTRPVARAFCGPELHVDPFVVRIPDWYIAMIG